MRYIAFKRHLILISFDVVIAGKKKPAGEAGNRDISLQLLTDHFEVEGG